uniref:Uncharacterized protein n=1 Tax=Otolemur garnettii TaxID=30611 RepID=H0XNM5_OTOGA
AEDEVVKPMQSAEVRGEKKKKEVERKTQRREDSAGKETEVEARGMQGLREIYTTQEEEPGGLEMNLKSDIKSQTSREVEGEVRKLSRGHQR